MAKPRVFISSTFYDLRQIREDIERFIQQLGYESVRNETGEITYGNQFSPEEYAYREAESCDIFVSIIGGRFGTVSAQEPDTSISQRELRRALQRGIQVFIFIQKDVYTEYRTYLVNKDTPDMRFRFADNVLIYKFIEELEQLRVNNPIAPFDTAADITAYLQSQFSGLFWRLMKEQREASQSKLPPPTWINPAPLPALTDAILRHLIGQTVELPDGVVALRWRTGPTFDVEVVGLLPEILENFSLEVIEVLRWNEEHARFVQSQDI